MHETLDRWISVWHPRYRRLLVLLLLVGTVVGGSVYLENALLRGMVQSLADDGSSGLKTVSLAEDVFGVGAAPLALLVAVFAVGLSRALLLLWRKLLSARMYIVGREDLERQLLTNLLMRDDAFFGTHSMGEIMNRIEVDLIRVVHRREQIVDLWWSVLVLVSNLLFFFIADWRLALLILAICALGTFYTRLVSKPLHPADQAYFAGNDQVKMDFADYLQATPEIQVGGLYETILARFRRPQGERLEAFRKWVRADAKVDLTMNAWPVIAFLGTVGVVIWAAGGNSGQLALIPVLILALPQVFVSATNLVTLRIAYRLASNSARRLQEYDAPSTSRVPIHAPPREHCAALTVELDDVTSRYTNADGESQGGVAGVSARLESGTWSAVVGEAGAGKSTLINLLLGRRVAQSGTVRYRGDGQSFYAAQLPELATLMPQRTVLFATSMRENLLIGLSPGQRSTGFVDARFDILDGIGLSDLCRERALDMHPAKTGRELGEEELARLRLLSRRAAGESGVPIDPWEAERCADSNGFAGDTRVDATWRENLLRGSVRGQKPDRHNLLDDALCRVLADGPWERFFVEQGLEFHVGRGGTHLSGGQQQLVALGRALFRGTQLLILDEPTSALDPQRRDMVIDFLKKWRTDRVVVTISHDPQFIRHADQVLLLSGGRIVKTGEYKALLDGCPAFGRTLGFSE